MKKVRTFIIDREDDSVKKISGLLKNVSDLEIVQTSTSLMDLEAVLREKISSLVLIGPYYEIGDIEKILSSHSADLFFVKVILLVKETSASLLRKAIKLNIHDVLEFPFTFNDLKESIKRVEEAFRGVLAEKPEAGKEVEIKEHPGSKIIMVFSTKGGSGTSFIATNTAVDLISQNKKGVVLFDLNYQFGDAALMLNLYPKHTVYEVMSVIDQLDSEMLNSFLTTHSSGVKVLPVPIEPSQGEAISTKATMKIIEILSQISDYTVIDTPSVFSENVLSLLERTDYLCMVASMDVPSIKNLKVSLQVLDQLNFPREKVFIILNRADSKVGITIDEIEKTIQRKIDVAIPSNRIVPLTVNRGIPVVIDAPKSPVSKNIRRLTMLLIATKSKRKIPS
ncbi:MAG: hypothetical protein M1371_04700 [Actinobacteria bacterium]|nr:hypothetical protein [Actinomycetota bacterium]